jgi:hypothetical protein
MQNEHIKYENEKLKADKIFWSRLMDSVLARGKVKRLGALERRYKI